MNIKTILLAATLGLASHTDAHAQVQTLPSSCPGFPSNLLNGGPAGPAFIGTTFAVHWATPAWICSPPPLSLQTLLLGLHTPRVFDFGGRCRSSICTIVDVLPVIALPPNSPPGSSSGWVFQIPADPTLQGAFFDLQIVAPTCVTSLPGSCLATGRPYRVTVQ